MQKIIMYIGQFQKIFVPLPQVVFWNSECMGGGGFFDLEFRMHGGGVAGIGIPNA